MIYEMKLKNEPFNSIKQGKKTIEMRLFDEKRQLLKINDTIQFTNIITNEKINVLITNLYKFNNFEELYNHFDKVCLGYSKNQNASHKDMEQYYSLEEQKIFGVLGIEIKLI